MQFPEWQVYSPWGGIKSALDEDQVRRERAQDREMRKAAVARQEQAHRTAEEMNRLKINAAKEKQVKDAFAMDVRGRMAAGDPKAIDDYVKHGLTGGGNAAALGATAARQGLSPLIDAVNSAQFAADLYGDTQRPESADAFLPTGVSDGGIGAMPFHSPFSDIKTMPESPLSALYNPLLQKDNERAAQDVVATKERLKAEGGEYAKFLRKKGEIFPGEKKDGVNLGEGGIRLEYDKDGRPYVAAINPKIPADFTLGDKRFSYNPGAGYEVIAHNPESDDLKTGFRQPGDVSRTVRYGDGKADLSYTSTEKNGMLSITVAGDMTPQKRIDAGLHAIGDAMVEETRDSIVTKLAEGGGDLIRRAEYLENLAADIRALPDRIAPDAIATELKQTLADASADLKKIGKGGSIGQNAHLQHVDIQLGDYGDIIDQISASVDAGVFGGRDDVQLNTLANQIVGRGARIRQAADNDLKGTKFSLASKIYQAGHTINGKGVTHGEASKIANRIVNNLAGNDEKGTAQISAGGAFPRDINAAPVPDARQVVDLPMAKKAMDFGDALLASDIPANKDARGKLVRDFEQGGGKTPAWVKGGVIVGNAKNGYRFRKNIWNDKDVGMLMDFMPGGDPLGMRMVRVYGMFSSPTSKLAVDNYPDKIKSTVISPTDSGLRVIMVMEKRDHNGKPDGMAEAIFQQGVPEVHFYTLNDYGRATTDEPVRIMKDGEGT